MTEVSTLVSGNFTATITISQITNNATMNTLNYRWIPDTNSTYIWDTLPNTDNNVDTYIRLYSSNISTYNTNIRVFDGVQYGLVTVNDNNGGRGDYFSRLLINGFSYPNQTLIMAVGLYETESNKTFNISLVESTDVSTLVSANFTETITISQKTHYARVNTLNYRWIPDTNSVYTWETLANTDNNVDTYIRLYSSNISTYNTNIRVFDGVQYGLVIQDDDSGDYYFSRLIINGNNFPNQTLIMAVGLYDTNSNKTFNISANTTGVWIQPPISNICFPAGTPITTNQGNIPIEHLNPKFHTIHNKKIVGITKTITQDKYLVCFEKDALKKNIPSQKTIISKNHKIFCKGEFIKANEYINYFENVKKVKYTGEVLYNVLMEEYDKMMVNNLICETLHPENCMAKLYKDLQTLNPKEQEQLIKKYNEYIIKKNLYISKK